MRWTGQHLHTFSPVAFHVLCQVDEKLKALAASFSLCRRASIPQYPITCFHTFAFFSVAMSPRKGTTATSVISCSYLFTGHSKHARMLALDACSHALVVFQEQLEGLQGAHSHFGERAGLVE